MKPTREQIESATPDELNVMVAEMVGWVWVRPTDEGWPQGDGDGRWLCEPGRAHSKYWQPCTPDEMALPIHESCTEWVPNRSTDIAASLDGVIGFMAEQGYWCIMKTPFQPGGAFHAGFTPHNTTGWNGRADYRGSGRALPLAICRAALLWWIEQEENGE